MATKKSQEMNVRVVTLPCKENRPNVLRLVRDQHGVIWAESQARHDGVEVYSLFKLGQAWELIPRLVTLT